MGNSYFSKLQIGKETVRGTAVAADTLLLGLLPQINPDRKPVFPADRFGKRSDAVRSELHSVQFASALNFPNLYYQALPLIFSLGLKGAVAPVETTPAQGDYLWTFTPSETATNSPDSMTLEAGDNDQAYEVEHVMADRITLSGNVAQGADASPVVAEVGVFGRQWTKTTFTAGLTIPTVEPVIAKLARVYKDALWANAGVTELALALRSFRLEILTGLYPVFTGSASRYFGGFEESVIGVTLALTLHPTAAVIALYDDFNNGDSGVQDYSVWRVKCSGKQIGTGGNHELTIDVGGYLADFTPVGAQDRGSNLFTATVKGVFDITGAKKLAVTCQTDVAAI
jgi:hypothetical protein